MPAPGDLPEVPADALASLPPFAAGDPGLWRYAPAIPVSTSVGRRLSLGEGITPLVAAAPELPDVLVKMEFLSPTLSFKDRGAVVLIAAAVERGARCVIADSSGNAGSAIAAYAARAGLVCQVFMPDGTSERKVAQARAYGASVELVPGDRTASTEAAKAEVRRSGAMYASHIYDPMFLHGTKTFAFELWEQLGGAPDALVLPVGNGTLVLGALLGFRELLAAGLVHRVPPVIAVQSERCAPLAAAWAAGLDSPADVTPGSTVAEGIAIPRPPRGAQILASVRASGGCIVAVPEEAVLPAQAELATRGMFVEPTAAVVWAAALMLRDSDAAPSADDAWATARKIAQGRIVVPLCGAGVKAL